MQMLKKIINFTSIFLTSGVLFHRCTLIGLLCAVWVYFGASEDESLFRRMLSIDLYLFMAAILTLYRMMFKKILTKSGDLDLKTMIVYCLGDVLWASTAMYCAVPFFMLMNYSGTEYSEKARAAINPHRLMRQIPRP